MPFSSGKIKREAPQIADIWPAIKRAAKLKMTSSQRARAMRLKRRHARSDRETALAGGPAAKARAKVRARGARRYGGTRRGSMSAGAYKRSRRQAALKAWRTRKGRSGSSK